MKTNNILKALAFALLITTACNKSEIANDQNTEKKGYELPVTVNVTREGDDATKATYNDGTKKLSFSAGDKLFVQGTEFAFSPVVGQFAGTLTWVSGNSFSGTIVTEIEYPGTFEELLTYVSSNGIVTATLLPAGYESYDYLEIIEDVNEYENLLGESANNSFATSKQLAVEQLSYETGSFTSGTGFVLEPQNAILNFTITGLTASTEVTATLTDGSPLFNIEGDVTTDGSGNATFAMGVLGTMDLNGLSLTVAGNPVTLVNSSTELAAGKIYNITRSAVDPNAPLPGIFSISAGQTVQFSKGNLQYQASTDTWRFAEHQYDYVGNAAGNNTSSDRDTQSGWIDLFGWGTSGKTFASGYGTAYQPWTTSTTNNQYGPTDGTSGLTGDYANGDWGVNMGTGWRTLTSSEWSYLFNTRTTGGTVFGTAQARYTEATINTDGTGVNGIILFPDGVDIASGEVTTAGTVNSGSAWATKCTTAQWAALESKGCVFLPAAGYRSSGTSVTSAGSVGVYWSSTPNGSNNAYALNFMSNNVIPAASGGRRIAGPVRLVQEVVTP